MKKSTNGTLAKTETKHANGAKAEASIRRSSRLTNSEVNSKEAETNTGNSNQRTSLTSITSLKTSEVQKLFFFSVPLFSLITSIHSSLVSMFMTPIMSTSLEYLQ